ncbi:hypothetical protein KY290_033731 [Solanum tuberosum]|uniref:Transmembrane protein n=1 Tax=Solanum tuberosum TaxID=4113 RepID=A0ABQ7U2Z5_SOLTU|nr:hypothetical protein KY289_033104 [Solanum tuberosum]KAH0647744.1 hypothetical protein KY285_032992 [Solanum tuberosum]KAH0740688.1 hypothetical protein KY290_033731 [Solanum tuberosum]
MENGGRWRSVGCWLFSPVLVDSPSSSTVQREERSRAETQEGERQPAAAGLVGVLLHLLVLMGFTGVADGCSYCFSPKRKREEIEGAVDLGEERRKE